MKNNYRSECWTVDKMFINTVHKSGSYWYQYMVNGNKHFGSRWGLKISRMSEWHLQCQFISSYKRRECNILCRKNSQAVKSQKTTPNSNTNWIFKSPIITMLNKMLKGYFYYLSWAQTWQWSQYSLIGSHIIIVCNLSLQDYHSLCITIFPDNEWKYLNWHYYRIFLRCYNFEGKAILFIITNII